MNAKECVEWVEIRQPSQMATLTRSTTGSQTFTKFETCTSIGPKQAYPAVLTKELFRPPLMDFARGWAGHHRLPGQLDHLMLGKRFVRMHVSRAFCAQLQVAVRAVQ